MSLINDAIKQANKASKERAFAAAQPATAHASAPAAFQVAPRSEGNSSLYLIGGVVVFILLGGLFLVLASRGGDAAQTEIAAGARETATPAPMTVATAAIETTPAVEPVVSRPAPGAETAITSLPATPAPAETAPVLTSTTPTAPAPEPVAEAAPEPVLDPVPTEFPELKLQGIYYRLNNPSVMINGKTLERGDYLTDHVRVVQIERRSVLVEMNGQTRLLRMN